VSYWQLISKIGLIVAIVGLIGYLFIYLRNKHQLKAAEAQRVKAQRAARLRAAAERAAREKAIQDGVAAMQAKAQQVAARRVSAEQAAAERAAAERAAAENAIAEWISAEEAEARAAASLQAQEEDAQAAATEAKKQAAEEAIAEWTAKMQAEVENQGGQWSPKIFAESNKKVRKIDAIKEQVFAMVEHLHKEADELKFITNEIRTQVEFLPIDVNHTIEKWKKGQVHRGDSLEDLKLKFRFNAYSIQDGWDILHSYRDWILQQHDKLRVFIRLLSGTEIDNADNIGSAIGKTEKTEWAKYLDMDMDVIFTLKQMREILTMTSNLDPQLNALEKACRERSEQIITPSWDHKGTL
jgi:hypothetical protein